MQLIALIFRAFWKTVAFLSVIVGITYLPADIWGLAETYPWLASMTDAFQAQAAWWLLGFAGLYIAWIDARPLIRSGLAGKNIIPRNLFSRGWVSLPDENQDLIPINIVILGERHDDGADIRFGIVIRNRSDMPLVIGFNKWDCEIAGVVPKSRKGVSCSSEMPVGKNQQINLANIRIYDVDRPLSGWAMLSLAFGPTKEKLRYSMVVRCAVNNVVIPPGNKRFKLDKLDAKFGAIYAKRL